MTTVSAYSGFGPLAARRLDHLLHEVRTAAYGSVRHAGHNPEGDCARRTACEAVEVLTERFDREASSGLRREAAATLRAVRLIGGGTVRAVRTDGAEGGR